MHDRRGGHTLQATVSDKCINTHFKMYLYLLPTTLWCVINQLSIVSILFINAKWGLLHYRSLCRFVCHVFFHLYLSVHHGLLVAESLPASAAGSSAEGGFFFSFCALLTSAATGRCCACNPSRVGRLRSGRRVPPWRALRLRRETASHRSRRPGAK